MKSTDPNIQTIAIDYDGSNNLIAGTAEDRKTLAVRVLQGLDSAGKTVILTDPYLFSNYDQGYERDLKDILKSLRAAQIVYCAASVQNNALFLSVRTELQTHGCSLIHKNTLTDCHDRFWYCVQSDKAAVFGNSLNGLCKRICRVDMLKPEEVAELRREFGSRGVL